MLRGRGGYTGHATVITYAMKLRPLLAIASLALVGTSIAYRDLIASAFDTNPFPGSAPSVARGKALYERNCQVCHGAAGRGDGPAAQSLQTRMDDLSDLPPPPIFPDGVIVYRIAHGKGLMPAWGRTLSHDDLWDLLNYLRSLKSTAGR